MTSGTRLLQFLVQRSFKKSKLSIERMSTKFFTQNVKIAWCKLMRRSSSSSSSSSNLDNDDDEKKAKQ